MEKHYTIEEVFNLLGESNLNGNSVNKTETNTIIVDGYPVYAQSFRYKLFYQKGLSCVCCGKQGAYFTLDTPRDCKKVTERTHRHFNLHAADGTLMTKDHILPKSLGGEDALSNFQTMCEDCNKNKGNTSECEIDLYVATDGNKRMQFPSVKDIVMYFVSNTSNYCHLSNKKLVSRTFDITSDIMDALRNGLTYQGYMIYRTREVYRGKSNN